MEKKKKKVIHVWFWPNIYTPGRSEPLCDASHQTGQESFFAEFLNGPLMVDCWLIIAEPANPCFAYQAHYISTFHRMCILDLVQVRAGRNLMFESRVLTGS